jgi:hypothetical protein
MPNNKAYYFFMYVLMIFLVINSGSSMGIFFGNITIPIFILSALLISVLYGKGLDIRNVIIFITIVFICLISYYMNFDYKPNTESYLILFMNLLATALFVSSTTFTNFKKVYINTMFFIAIYCLVIFIIGINFNLQQYAFYLGQFPNFMGYNLYAIEKMRNSGIFWEPGGYQIFLNLALIFMLDQKEAKYNSKKDWIKVIIFIISILTTKSTTGYIILGILLAYFFLRNIRRKNTINAVMYSFLILPVLFILILFLFNSDAVTMKFTETNYSFIERKNHLFSSLHAISQGPWFGFGYQSIIRNAVSYKYGLINNSVGFFSTTLNFGIFYTVFYVLAVIITFKKIHYFNLKVFIAIFVIIGFSQAIFDYPIQMMFLFYFQKKYHPKTNIIT